jgi:exodeoxyribonuclease-1
MAASILWYDLETFGLESRYDRIAQFASVRTDENLNSIGEPVVLYCKPTPDYLPNPQSCLVHGIIPQHALERGLCEYDFATRIRAEMSVPSTTTAGFNSIQFDDEFIRNLLYRNLYDVYEREWKDGNSRWDIIDLMRAARDLRPEGIVWPEDGSGRPIFKLEVLAKANGIAHGVAHDALHDVGATIGLAKLVRTRQPRLYDWYFTHRFRGSLRPLVDLADRKMLVHSAAEYTSERGCTTLVAPVAMDPENGNQLVAIDLRYEPESLVELDVDEIRRRVFTKSSDLDAERVPLSRIRLNRCPFLAPLSTLGSDAAKKLGIDQEVCARRLSFIAAHPELLQKLVAVFAGPVPVPDSSDPELRMYSGGFYPDADKVKLTRIHEAIAQKGAQHAREFAYKAEFRDERIPALVRRLYARNYPETLSVAEAAQWRSFCAGRMQLPPVSGVCGMSEYAAYVEGRIADSSAPARERSILHALLDWKASIEREVLAYGEKG